MSRILVVANRLPVTVECRHGTCRAQASVGGVATGLSSLRDDNEMLWIGSIEAPSSPLTREQQRALTAELRVDHDSVPVFLTKAETAGFYQGFSNRTIWPLFHYFTRYAEFDRDFWMWYVKVNRRFADAVLAEYRTGDRIWVHDYQLLLVPAMLRESLSEHVAIGFFLHIPFPAYDVFRLLPWRRELLKGVLGAGLIGFHTYDYAAHFLTSAKSLLGIDDRNGVLQVGSHLALVDAFPMGIDFERYASASRSHELLGEAEQLVEDGKRLVLSVDRLDYTKGIPERLIAFDRFLRDYPEWRDRVSMVCVGVPSRSRVWRYRELKRQVDGLVGDINGRWGTIDWTPIRYMSRAIPFPALTSLYAAADVALVTPLRDGMNLVAKEYLAAHVDRDGVLVLSELAGAARELPEALIVNPHDLAGVAAAIDEALSMPEAEQRRRNKTMTDQLREFDVHHWAREFMSRLDEVMMRQLAIGDYLLTEEPKARLVAAAQSAEKRLLILDHDGTLVPIRMTPRESVPDAELIAQVRELASDPATDVVICSGRVRSELERWFGTTGASLVAEHGAWIKEAGDEWRTSMPLDRSWIAGVRKVMERYASMTPGAFIEEKDYSIAWHSRRSPENLVRRRLPELIEHLGPLVTAGGLSVVNGDHVLEVRPDGIDKGNAAHRWLGSPQYDFILVMGDDATDEDMFAMAPESAFTVKVGVSPTAATFCVERQSDARELLTRLVRTPVPMLTA